MTSVKPRPRSRDITVTAPHHPRTTSSGFVDREVTTRIWEQVFAARPQRDDHCNVRRNRRGQHRRSRSRFASVTDAGHRVTTWACAQRPVPVDPHAHLTQAPAGEVRPRLISVNRREITARPGSFPLVTWPHRAHPPTRSAGSACLGTPSAARRPPTPHPIPPRSGSAPSQRRYAVAGVGGGTARRSRWPPVPASQLPRRPSPTVSRSAHRHCGPRTHTNANPFSDNVCHSCSTADDPMPHSTAAHRRCRGAETAMSQLSAAPTTTGAPHSPTISTHMGHRSPYRHGCGSETCGGEP